MSLAAAIEQTITVLELADPDKAVAELALVYARTIDDDSDQLEALGPKLLAALESLGASPRARAAIKKGVSSGNGPSPLDELRAKRDARQRDAATVDAAAP